MAAVNQWGFDAVAALGDQGVNAPPYHAAAVTPSDSDELATVCRALYIGGAGTVTVVTVNNETVQFTCPAGAYLFGFFKQVKSTGTSATLIVAQW